MIFYFIYYYYLDIKLLVLGGPASGKTSIVRRYIYGENVQPNYSPTCGLDLYTCKLNAIKTGKFQLPIRLQLYDVPHAEVCT